MKNPLENQRIFLVKKDGFSLCLLLKVMKTEKNF